MDKKGQAAMEFLMTYGWAILAAIVAIAALAYFGVFSPGKLVADSVTLSAPFSAKAATISATQVQIELLQNLGETINITSITVGSCPAYTSSANLASGNTTVYTIPCNNTIDTQFKGDITVKYYKAGSSLELQSTGSITSRVR
jgi:uncharacterized protein (UPF0333 family)